MTKKKGLKKFFVILLNILLLAQLLSIGVFLNPKKAKAANCGDGIGPCACGDTVIADYTLTSNMNCTGYGLIVGANNITINGGGYTISGDYSGIDYGIYNASSYDNVTVENLTIENYYVSLCFIGSTGSIIDNINFNNNSWAIALYSSSSNTLTNNSLTNNHNNFDIDNYINSIDTTNTIEGKPVYYLYNHSDETYDGDVVGDIGMFWCISCNNVTVRNAELAADVYFKDTTNSFIENITANDLGAYAIRLVSSTGNSLTSNTANNNTGTGFYISDSSNGNNLIGNTANNNNNGFTINNSTGNTLTGNSAGSNGRGIELLNSSTGNNLISNMINNNGDGIYIYFSADSNTLTGNTVTGSIFSGIYITTSSNTLTNNSMVGNEMNMKVADNYNNNINTTNTIEGKPVYYLYNHSDETYDGDVVGDIGMFWCISCNNVTVRNAELAPNNVIAIYFRSTTNSFIENMTISNNRGNIRLDSSSGNTISGNTSYYSGNGIYLWQSSGNNLTNNIFKNHSLRAIWLASSSSNTLTGNKILFNNKDIEDDGSNTYSSNEVLHNLQNEMISFTEVERSKSLNDTVSFDIDMLDIEGSTCGTCTYDISTSPTETVNVTKVDNTLTGNFQVTKPGTYSLIAKITDPNNNFTERKYLFLVNATGSKTTKYYLRDTKPRYGQPTGSDTKSMLFSAPSQEEWWECAWWVQNSPDELPDYLWGILEEMDINSWYKTEVDAGMGYERFVTRANSVDNSQAISAAEDYTWINRNFSSINWGMDYFVSWYYFALKIVNANGPHWRTIPAQPSYADITHAYATTPPVKSTSNENVVVLSATADAVDSDNYYIVLNNPFSDAATTSVAFDLNRGLIDGETTRIDSGGGSSLTNIALAGNETKTTNFTPSDADFSLTPSAGYVDVAINTWETSGDYYKKWTEEGSAAGITSQHTIGDLKTNTQYTVKVNSSPFGIYTSNGSGEITFTYNGGYSTKTFEVGEDNTPPSIIVYEPTGNSSTDQESVTLRGKVTDADSGVSTLRVNGVNTSFDGQGNFQNSILLNIGTNTITVRAEDVAGNSAQQIINITRIEITTTSQARYGYKWLKAKYKEHKEKLEEALTEEKKEPEKAVSTADSTPQITITSRSVLTISGILLFILISYLIYRLFKRRKYYQ